MGKIAPALLRELCDALVDNWNAEHEPIDHQLLSAIGSSCIVSWTYDGDAAMGYVYFERSAAHESLETIPCGQFNVDVAEKSGAPWGVEVEGAYQDLFEKLRVLGVEQRK